MSEPEADAGKTEDPKNWFSAPQVTWAQYTIYMSDFTDCDTDNSNDLNYDECTVLLEKQLGRPPTQEFLQRFFAAHDLNHDQRITLDGLHTHRSVDVSV